MSFKDDASVSDAVTVGIDTTVAAPVMPCVKCGRETKPHHDITDGNGDVVGRRRICSNRACRHVVEAA